MTVDFGIYGIFDNKSGDCLYIGVSKFITKGLRMMEHLKPSKSNESPINRYLRDNDDWSKAVLVGTKGVVLKTDFNVIIDSEDKEKTEDIEIQKSIMHSIEMTLVKKYKPLYNGYGK